MPKLLIVTTMASTLSAFLLPYARHFRKIGWTVDAMANGVSVCPECREAFDQCHEMPFSRSPLNIENFSINSKIREIAANGEYDIIHVHTAVAAFVTRLALRKMRGKPRPKIVYTSHGFHFYEGGGTLKNAAFAALERLAGDLTDHTITINEDDYEAALAYKISEPERLSLMPGLGIDLNRQRGASADEVKKLHAALGLEKSNWPFFMAEDYGAALAHKVSTAGNLSPEQVKAEAKKLQTKLKLKNDDELFLMAEEFAPIKRHEDAIRALAITGMANFHLAFAGAGPLEDSMKQLASKLGVAPRVHFLGERHDIPLLMRSARALILPSAREGLSRSVMEAINLGVPVLGAYVRGIRDLIDSPARGILFPAGNQAALAAAMILIMEDRRPISPTPDPLWSIDHLLSEHEALYRKLLQS